MLLFKTVEDLQNHIAQQKQNGKTIGFIPTMGALHQGHISLMKQSISQNDNTVCSIFVNPTQFNQAEDLEKYPRTLEKDIEMLTEAGVDILFLPEVNEVYPDDWKTPVFDFQGLDELMEGEHRPGHFAGVAQVVHRLLVIVQPTAIYMGQKDYQQWRIVQSMLTQLGSDVHLKRCDIERHPDGLAMSSRNLRLPAEARLIAPNVNKVLELARQEIQTHSIQEVLTNAKNRLNAIEEFTLDYFEIVDGQTLQREENKANTESLVACTAVFLANIRLIDNVILK
jgi:pantoate--beta-alanine ligase